MSQPTPPKVLANESKSLTSEDIKALMRRRYRDFRQWIYFEECPVGTGWKGSRFMDAYVIAAWPSANNLRMAFEIKVSRADFLNEIKNPAKRRAALFFSNQFYFVAPKGMIKPDELPAECGLMEADGTELRVKIEAPTRESIRPTWNFVATLLRKMTTDHATGLPAKEVGIA